MVKKKKSNLQKRKDNPRSSYWKKKADAEWGKVIHSMYKECAICGASPVEAHHLISRGNLATRHCIENGIGLCSTHHKWCNKLSAHGAPLAFAEWLQREMPLIWEWCSENKHKTQKPDYEASYYELVKWLEKNQARY